jgi:hypothetical protein
MMRIDQIGGKPLYLLAHESLVDRQSIARFDIFQLDDRHVVAVARGPLCDAIESFQAAAFPFGLPSSTDVEGSRFASIPAALERKLIDFVPQPLLASYIDIFT